MGPERDARFGTLVVAAVVVGMATLFALSPTGDPDVFWHLKTGQMALALRSSLPRDAFSFSYDGAPWHYKDLLADVLLYAGFAVFRFGWFAILKGAAAVAIALGYARVPRRSDRQPAALLLTVGLVLSSLWLVERPNLFSMLLFPLFLALLERARRRLTEPRAPSNRELAGTLVPLLALEWLWALLHRAALLGLVLLLGLAVYLLVCRLRRAESVWLDPAPAGRSLGAAFAAAGLAPALVAVNPSGLWIFRTGIGVAGSEQLRRYISEWQRIGLGEFLRVFPIGAALVAAAIAGWFVCVALGQRRLRRPPVTLWHLGLLALFGALAFDTVRWVPYLVMTSALVVQLLVGEVMTGSPLRPRALVVASGALALALAWSHRAGAGPLALGEAENRYPTGAVAFAAQHGLSGKVANALQFGGYLIWERWPSTRVLVDGRNETVYSPAFVSECIDAETNADLFFAMRQHDGAGWVVAGNLPRAVTHRFLFRSRDWALVYWSEAATIYVRRAEHPELAALEYQWVDPAAPDVSVIAAFRTGDRAQISRVKAELSRMLEASPRSVRALTALCLFYHLMGPPSWQDRDQILGYLREIAGDEPVVKELGRRLGR